MKSNTRVLSCLFNIIVLLIFSLAAGAFAQEHPKQEHPKEHPKGAAAVTKEGLAEAIEGYIKKDTALKGGYFCVYDEKAKAPLALKLDKVHQDKLSRVSDDLFFACSDFKATDGKTYDLDFFMKATDVGLEVSEVMIHKEAGIARYGWVEEDGVWSRK